MSTNYLGQKLAETIADAHIHREEKREAEQVRGMVLARRACKGALISSGGIPIFHTDASDYERLASIAALNHLSDSSEAKTLLIPPRPFEGLSCKRM
jgi:hypothetical protein